MSNNRARILSQVLSLDGWHEPFRVDGSTSGVFVELSFHEGRIGGDNPDFPFTFKVSLKRALVTLKVEAPLEIDRKTIARSIPEKEIELTTLRAAKEKAELTLGGSAKLSPAALAAALQGEATRTQEIGQESELRVVEKFPETLVNPRPGHGQQYSWELEPTYRPALRGQPWNPLEPPRLRIKSLLREEIIPPAVKVEITCALEDIEITDFKPKDTSIQARLKQVASRTPHEAAAVQHIKKVLRDADLEAGELDNRFSELLIASVLAVQA